MLAKRPKKCAPIWSGCTKANKVRGASPRLSKAETPPKFTLKDEALLRAH